MAFVLCSNPGDVPLLLLCQDCCNVVDLLLVLSSEKPELKNLPWLKVGAKPLGTELLTRSIFSLSSEGSISTGSIILDPIKELEDSEVDTIPCSFLEEGTVVPLPTVPANPQLQSSRDVSRDGPLAKTTSDNLCQLGPSHGGAEGAVERNTAVIEQVRTGPLWHYHIGRGGGGTALCCHINIQ